MKRILTFLFFWLAILSANAQFILYCSGTVTNLNNGTPVANHEVVIQSDTLAGTSGYFYDVVMTDAAGHYADSIVPANSQTSGTVIIKTMDCQNYYNVYTASYSQQNWNIQHNFSICYFNVSCAAAFYASPDPTLAQTFNFIDQSTGSSLVTWMWDFGDGTYLTVNFPGNPNVTHTYIGSAVTHTACLTIFSSDSCENSYCQTITINPTGCIANFTYSDSTNISNPVQFVDLSQTSGGAIIAWYWNFGDPNSGSTNTSIIQNPVHTFSQPGIYNVCLTIQGADSSCFDMMCQSVAVGNNGGCNAMFTYTASPNAFDPVQFSDLSTTPGGSIVSWHWDFGDPVSGSSNTSTLQNPTHTFAAIGIYNVCLSIYGTDSCYDVTCQAVNVGGGSGCQAYFISSVDSISVPAGTPVQFTDESGGSPTGWYWNFGDPLSGSDNSSSLQNPEHLFSGSGFYNVCLTISGLNCQDTYCRTVQIGNGSGCSSSFEYTAAYLSVTFHGSFANNTPGGDFSWLFGDSYGGQGQTVTHIYPGPGIYTVVLTALDSSGCSSTYTQNITVYDSLQLHQVYGQVFAGNFPLLTGMVMIFSLDTTANYMPYVGVSTIDSSGIYYFTMVPDGNYYIYAIPVLPSGYLPTYYGDVLNWENAPLVQLGPATNPYNINLLPASSATTGNGTINGQIGMGQLKTSMLDKITMLLMDNNLNSIYYYQVGTNGDFTFPSLSYGTYWLKAEIAGVTSDLVKVEISEANPVANVVMTFTGNKILGIEGSTPDLNAGTLYPNPASDVAYLALGAKQNLSIQVNLYNLSGQDVFHMERSIAPGNTLLSIPVAGLPRGIYTLQVRSSEGFNIIRKLVR